MHWLLLVTMMQPCSYTITLQHPCSNQVCSIAGQGCHRLIPRLISEILSGVSMSKMSSSKMSKIRLSCHGMIAFVR